MREPIRQYAIELGFDVCRFTAAAPPESAPWFQSWLAAGKNGEMAYLRRNAEKRVDPQRVLPEATTIVTLAASYATARSCECVTPGPAAAQLEGPNSKIDSQGSHGRSRPAGIVARYARFTDYHRLLGDRLKDLVKFMTRVGGEGTRSLWYVDTGPLLERDIAQRAGLGFVGKHTNLINRRLGNWFFIAEVITTLQLKEDLPEKNRCGSCTRCITACPTAAITAPFQLDARRCISYLTIELKGSIPVELRAAIGNRIFGCDDCLAVCPWNRFAREGNLMKQHARPELVEPDLLDLLALDDDGFQRRFAGTPILRTKRRSLLRNVCVALGNVGGVATLPALDQTAHDPDPLIAEHARWAIEQIEKRTEETSSAS
jgi:epoxyqueuosine reductase